MTCRLVTTAHWTRNRSRASGSDPFRGTAENSLGAQRRAARPIFPLVVQQVGIVRRLRATRGKPIRYCASRRSGAAKALRSSGEALFIFFTTNEMVCEGHRKPYLQLRPLHVLDGGGITIPLQKLPS
jgi:hypothetical protein